MRGRHPVLAAVSRGCPRARGRFPRVTHPSATERRAEARRPVRLACVRRAASVRSEPGSNSQFDLPPPQVWPEEAGVRLHGITAQGRPKAVAPQRRSPPWAAHPPGSPGRRSPAGLPRQALKGDRLEPRARVPPRPSPRRPTRATPRPAATRTPEHDTAARTSPATFQMPEPRPKAAAHASLPLFTCPKINPASGSSSRSNPWVRGTSGHGREPGQALTIAPDRVCRASRAPVQGPFGALARLTVFLMTTARRPCRWFAARPRALPHGSLDRLRPPPDDVPSAAKPRALAWAFHTFNPAGAAARSRGAAEGRRSGPALAATAHAARERSGNQRLARRGPRGGAARSGRGTHGGATFGRDDASEITRLRAQTEASDQRIDCSQRRPICGATLASAPAPPASR